VRTPVLERYGEPLRQAVNGVSRLLTTEELVGLNRAVDVAGTSPREAARAWLAGHKLDGA
jgi:osmoprotectant transport system substrate-binding protein